MDKPKVLIVDDEPDIVETIKFNLELEKIECIEAYEGEAALSKTKKENPDLIILDIMLPKMNGYKIARLLKFDEPTNTLQRMKKCRFSGQPTISTAFP